MADKDPKDMTDEELNLEIEKGVESEPDPKEEKKPDKKAEAKEPVEEKVEKPEPEEEEAEEADPEVKEEDKPPSRREQLRIQQVLQKLKDSKAAPVATPTAPESLDYEKTLDADPELIKKLEEDRKTNGEALYRQGMAQANSIRFHTRLEIDAPKTEAKYPQLDKTNEKFNPTLANAVNSMYLSAVGYDENTDTAQNPDIRYSEYIDSIFELAGEIAGEKVEETKKNIKKQAAKTGLRPDGSATKTLDLNKLPEQMSDEELDARIALAFPSN